MITLLRLIPIWAFAIAAALGVAGIQTWRLHTSQADFAQYAAQVDADKLDAEKKARATEKQRQADIDQVRNDAQKQKAIDDALAAQLRADGQLMRDQTAKLLSDRAALNSRLAARGKSIADLTGLLAKLRQELDDFAGEAAIGADGFSRAGLACERAYDSLKKRTPNDSTK